MKRITLLILFLVTLLPILQASAEVVVLMPCKDAFVCDCIPGANNPGLGNQYLGQGRIGNCYHRTFIQWDLSDIPDGATIDSAVYRIYCGQLNGSPSGEMAYYRVIEDWSETTVNYANMPDHTEDGAIFTTDWPSTGTWKSVDITDSVVDWFAGVLDNYGLYCHSRNCTSTSDCIYYSSRGPYTSYRPRLIVTYTDPTALDNVTWGGLKAH